MKNKSAIDLGKLGGLARAKNHTKEELSAMGKLGGWPKGKKRKPTRVI